MLFHRLANRPASDHYYSFREQAADREFRFYRHLSQKNQKVLENNLQIPLYLCQGSMGQVGKIATIENDVSGDSFIKPGNRPAYRGFAATRFSHESEGLTGANLEGHTIER
jgi:hypothetical protein